MRRASQKLYDRSSMELEATRSRFSQQVRAAWNPRDYGIYETPVEKVDGGTTTTKKNDSVELHILRKLEQIRLPEVDFRQANIRDVVGHFSTESRVNDPEPNDRGPKGVNFVLDLGDDGGGAAPGGGGDGFGGGAVDDPFATSTADPFATEGPAGAVPSGEVMITFSALDISLREALDIVCDLGDLKYRVRGSVVMIVPLDKADGDIGLRMYDVLPSLITKLTEIQDAVAQPAAAAFGGGGMGSLDSRGTGRGPQEDLKVVFDRLGVKWPSGSSIQHIAAIGKLVVANTPENLTEFERILAVLNVVPFQIEIESRFVEVAQTDLDSLGLEWLLTDDWELARKAGSGPTPGSEERVMIRQNSQNGGFTTGNRYLSNDGPGTETMADQLFAMSSVLTNPELTVVLHALQQSGHTDLLSAPKITTQSGQEATLKVVTEYIYPTEFETSGISSGNNNNVGNNDTASTIGAVVTPSAFETREVGVILSVLPEVTPEGSMINLTMSPVVVSEPTWKNYGSSYTSYDPNGNPIIQELNMEQPFFHKRELTTSMLIYNGATVVMGGMITEVRTDIDDRVPILGDIPIIGNLFRSRYEKSEKRNLLIFVSARLVDPAGRPLDSQQMSKGMSSIGASMAGAAPQ
jgi:general secretion pathway protein D